MSDPFAAMDEDLVSAAAAADYSPTVIPDPTIVRLTQIDPAITLLTEIRDLLVKQGTHLELIAADVERRALPLVYVPGGKVVSGEAPFTHYRDAEIARQAEIAEINGG